MSLSIETILSCDGGGQCPLDGAFNDGDGRQSPGYELRRVAKRDGWVNRGGLDFCPACAERMGMKPTPADGAQGSAEGEGKS